MIAFVIGNGLSRKGLDISSLLGKGLIVGCNEMYREFSQLDLIASVDGEITRSIKEEHKGLHVYRWGKQWFRSDTGENLGAMGAGHNAGQLALKATIEILQPETIYLLGIDFGGGRVYTDRKTLAPSNKSWNIWKSLMNSNVIRVGEGLKKEVPLNVISDVATDVGYLDNECITYEEFNERISLRKWHLT